MMKQTQQRKKTESPGLQAQPQVERPEGPMTVKKKKLDNTFSIVRIILAPGHASLFGIIQNSKNYACHPCAEAVLIFPESFKEKNEANSIFPSLFHTMIFNILSFPADTQHSMVAKRLSPFLQQMATQDPFRRLLARVSEGQREDILKFHPEFTAGKGQRGKVRTSRLIYPDPQSKILQVTLSL